MKRLLALLLLVIPSISYGAVHQIAQLTLASSAGVRASNASSIAISTDGNTIVVGSAGSRVRDNVDSGAVFVFVKPSGGWTDMQQTATLVASDGHFESTLGDSVSISGNTIVAGSPGGKRGGPGRSYIFIKPTGGWKTGTETAELTPSDGSSTDYFGSSASISGNTVVIAAFGVDDYQGAAYVYVEPSGGWTSMTETAKLRAEDGKPGDGLSRAAINGSMIATGADHFEHTATPGAGYVFTGSGSSWTQIAELRPSNWIPGDQFGDLDAFNGNTVVIGKTNASLEGVAYVYVKPSAGWSDMTETAELDPSLPPDSEFTAGAISANGSTILAAASGIGYVYVRPEGGWVTTSTPTLEFGSGSNLGYPMQIGTPAYAAVSAVVNDAAVVLLFEQ
jgi:hypothetical protein